MPQRTANARAGYEPRTSIPEVSFRPAEDTRRTLEDYVPLTPEQSERAWEEYMINCPHTD